MSTNANLMREEERALQHSRNELNSCRVNGGQIMFFNGQIKVQENQVAYLYGS